jgi:uncharacterized membrane protein YgaE (UPF0421/DUF939 family)
MLDNPVNRSLISSATAYQSRRQSVLFAMLFALEAAICAAVLWIGYTLAKAPDLGWAMVSAFLVLQPEFSQSLTIAFTRTAANLIGAAVGLAIGSTMGVGLFPLILSIVIASIICGLLRLDAALRTACVAIVIVLNANHTSLVASGAERFASVTIGCLTGVLLQMATVPLTCRLRAPTPAEQKDCEKHTE